MATTAKITPKLKIGSLFSGCGGLDCGFAQAGYELAWANDLNPDACETYRQNIGDIIEGDVNKIDLNDLTPIDVLAAGFPCQPFSNAGSRRGTNDIRGTLYESTYKFIAHFEPKVVVFENVRGFLSAKGQNGKLIDEITGELLEHYGYFSRFKLVNFSHFGIPQNRLRVILVASKSPEDLDLLYPDIPLDKDLSIKTTLKGVTNRLPNQKEIMQLNPQALHYGAMIPEGGSWKDLDYDVLPDRWKKIRDNMAKYHYPKFFRRHHRTEVMGTITAAFKPENAAVWHPTKGRIYTVREIARFQSFPDDFVFHGKSVKSKYQQIGNAVPPLFARQLADRIKVHITDSSDVKLSRDLPVSCELNVNKPLHLQKGRLEESFNQMRLSL